MMFMPPWPNQCCFVPKPIKHRFYSSLKPIEKFPLIESTINPPTTTIIYYLHPFTRDECNIWVWCTMYITILYYVYLLHFPTGVHCVVTSDQY